MDLDYGQIQSSDFKFSKRPVDVALWHCVSPWPTSFWILVTAILYVYFAKRASPQETTPTRQNYVGLAWGFAIWFVFNIIVLVVLGARMRAWTHKYKSKS